MIISNEFDFLSGATIHGVQMSRISLGNDGQAYSGFGMTSRGSEL